MSLLAELTPLRAAAEDALVMHYAPYSHFLVVAAVETVDGHFYGGSNVENSERALTVHAEENAVMAAIKGGALERCGQQFIKSVYTSCASNGSLCGRCRGIVNEFVAPGCVWVEEDTRDGTISSYEFAELPEYAPDIKLS